MPQCRPGKRRIAVSRKASSGVGLVLLATGLVGCSSAELEKFATEYESSQTSPAVSARTDTGLSQKVGTELLSVDYIITGGQEGFKGVAGQFERLLAGPGEDIKLERPVGVGGVEDILYIADAATKLVYKYDLTLKVITPLNGVTVHFAGEPGKLYAAKDRSFYVVDSIGKQVLHFSESGELKTKFQDLANLSRPMDVLVDEKSGDVYVADGSYSHIVVFNQFGKAIRALGQRGTGPGRFRAITGMAEGADGLFVIDRLELPVQVFTWEGAYRYSFGESELVFPSAIAVDRDQRVFVSDRSDNTLRVYQDGQLLLTYGGGGAAPGRFREVESLWVSGNLLYVADSLNKRVQVLRINPAARVPTAG
jgi:DNA-binding beta-propeller fold protein YncE